MSPFPRNLVPFLVAGIVLAAMAMVGVSVLTEVKMELALVSLGLAIGAVRRVHRSSLDDFEIAVTILKSYR